MSAPGRVALLVTCFNDTVFPGVGRVLVSCAGVGAVVDASPLAAAQELALPTGRQPAEVAGDYAARNGAILTSCACSTGSLEAVVEVVSPIGPAFLASDALTVRARARAVIDFPA